MHAYISHSLVWYLRRHLRRAAVVMCIYDVATVLPLLQLPVPQYIGHAFCTCTISNELTVKQCTELMYMSFCWQPTSSLLSIAAPTHACSDSWSPCRYVPHTACLSSGQELKNTVRISVEKQIVSAPKAFTNS